MANNKMANNKSMAVMNSDLSEFSALSFRQKMLIAMCLMTFVLALGIVGNMDYADEQRAQELYSEMVCAGRWPDYKERRPDCGVWLAQQSLAQMRGEQLQEQMQEQLRIQRQVDAPPSLPQPLSLKPCNVTVGEWY